MSILKIQPGEGKKTLVFATIGLLLNGGLTLGICSTDALFLSELGSDQLPVIYILLPFAMMVLTPLSSYTQSRFRIETVFRWTLFLTAFSAIGLGLSIQLAQNQAALYPILYAGKLFTVICYIGLYTIFWNYVDAYFSISEGKRLYGIINAGSCLGIILFGSLVVFLSDATSISNAYYLWAIASLLAWPLVRYVSRHFSNLEDSDLDLETEENPSNNVIHTTLDAIKKSRFAFFVALLYFLLPILTYTNEYLCYTVFSAQGDQQAIAALLGKLYGTANIFNLLISLFAFNALVSRLGVRNLVLVQPFVYFFVFIWYYSDLSFAAAVFGFFAYQSILPSIENNNANLLFNALPANQKRSIRTFIEGLGEPVAVAISGGFLLFFINAEAKAGVAVSAVGMAVFVGVVAYVINQLYVSSIHKNLKKNWADIVELKETASRAIRRSFGGKQTLQTESIHTLALRLRLTPETMTPEEITTFLIGASQQPTQGRALLQRCLDTSNASLLEAFRAAIPRLSPNQWAWARDILLPYGVLPSDGFEAYSAPTDKSELTIFQKELSQIVSSKQTDRVPDLLHHLGDDATRLDALKGLSLLVTGASSAVAREVSKWLPVAKPEELALMLRILRVTKHAESVRMLFHSGINFSREERRTVTALILGIGARTVPILVDTIRDPSVSFSSRSLALNTLALLSFPQVNAIWRELIEMEVSNVAMHHRMASAIDPAETEIGFQCLKRGHTDLRNRSLEWILEILAVIGRIPDYMLLLHSLRSQSPKEQANGVETIIEGVGISFYRRIEPFLQSYVGSDGDSHHRKSEKMRPMQIILHALSSQKEVLILAACHACFRGEVGLDEKDLWIALRKKPNAPLVLKCVGEYLVADAPASDNPCRIEKLDQLLRYPVLQSIGAPNLLGMLPFFEIERVQQDQPFSDQKLYLRDHDQRDGVDNAFLWLHALAGLSGQHDTVPEAASYITIHRDSIQRLIQIYPRMGFELMKLHLQTRNHA